MNASEILPLVIRLDRKYRKRFNEADRINEAEELARSLGRHDLFAVERAVDLVIEREPHYPTPRKILDAIAEITQRDADRRPRGSSSSETCQGCGSEYVGRFWWRRPKAPADVARAMAPGNPHPGFIRLGGRLHCDCSWAKMLRFYLNDDEMAAMLRDDPECPIVQREIRRRAETGGPRRSPLAALTASVGRSIEQGDAFEDPAPITGDQVRADLSWSDQRPLEVAP